MFIIIKFPETKKFVDKKMHSYFSADLRVDDLLEEIENDKKSLGVIERN